MSKTINKIHGLLAEFETPEQLIEAAEKTHHHGFRHTDAYTPFPIEEVSEAIGSHGSRLNWVIFICGFLGALSGFALQYFISAIDYPYNVGGKPYNSWPAFIPVIFELMVLLASFGAVFGMIIANGLPKPYHPIFNVESFAKNNPYKFYLCIESTDPLYDADSTKKFLQDLKPSQVFEVES